jgi:hypothetical protein
MSIYSLTTNRSNRHLLLVPRIFLTLALLLLAGLGSFSPTTTAQTGQVVINELMYHPATGTDDEWLELHNAGGSAVDLAGWAFTDGVDYTFPPGATIPAGGYLVVARDPARVAALYGIGGVLGPYDGRLDNAGERVALADAGSAPVDAVTYSDATPWPAAADGDGPSLELVNPAFDNDRFCAWRVSAGNGTPGAVNSAYAGDIPPCIEGAAHAPPFPTPAQSVTVTAWVQDNGALSGVTLYYHPETRPDFVALPMRDDGGGGDVTPGDGLYTAVIPPQADGAYVEFYLRAADDAGLATVVPAGAPRTTSTETGNPLSVTYLYQVGNTPPATGYPAYRLIFTAENWIELTTRNLYSDVLLDATFTYDGQVYYNVGVSYRGESSRDTWPRPYRVEFAGTHLFDDGDVRQKLNLISDELAREFLLWDLFQRAGLPGAQAKFVSLFVTEGYHGLYLDVEQVDEYLLARQFPGDDGGNLYRGEPGADLTYRGAGADAYRPYYLKKTNKAADDYSDVIALTDVLSNAPGATFQAQLEALADVDEWLRWFAVHAVVYNEEGALWRGPGDDYFLYRHPSDSRFVLLSWDHDTCFNDPWGSIWAPNLPNVRRILEYPPYTRAYYQNIAALMADEFSPATMAARIDALPDALDQDRWEIRWFMERRIPSLDGQLPDGTLSISTNGGAPFTVEAPSVTLEGACSPLRDVTVDGDAAVTYPTVDAWRYTKTLHPGANTVVVADGRDTRSVTITWQVFSGGPVTADRTLYCAASPYHITEDIVVHAGATLTIEPCTELHFSPGASLLVYGRLRAEGTAARPIVFTGEGGVRWGAIAFYYTNQDNRIAHAVVEWTTEETADLRAQGITAYASTLTLADSVVRHTAGSALHLQDSNSQILRNEIYDVQGLWNGLYGDGLKADGGQIVVVGNHLHDVLTSGGDGIQFTDMTITPVLRGNHVHHINDDCVDLNHSPGELTRNVLHDCGDKGISLGHVGTTTVVNNVIYNCAIGIAVKDAHQSTIAHVTVVDCAVGISLYEAHVGEGGGHATVVNSVLWSLTTPLDARDGSTLAVTYSDVQGGFGGAGNVAAEPRFRGAVWGDYRLQETSPCVDSGAAQGASAEDVKGVPRPIGPGYDMGAHEFFEFFEVYLPLALKNW